MRTAVLPSLQVAGRAWRTAFVQRTVRTGRPGWYCPYRQFGSELPVHTIHYQPNGPGDSLKVEARVRIPLGLPSSSRSEPLSGVALVYLRRDSQQRESSRNQEGAGIKKGLEAAEQHLR